MHTLIATIGTWKKSPEEELFAQYLSRMPWKVELREIEYRGHATDPQRKSNETQQLLAAAQSFHAHHTVALDPNGKAMTSEALAAQIGKWRDAGDAKLAFLIGSDAGMDATQFSRCDFSLSFGAVTWPHLLMRVLLAEQLYRAYTILTNHPYHRG